MRLEKKYLVKEVSQHLDKSNYVILSRFSKLTVQETATLRKELAAENAELHVVKNTILNVVAKERSFPEQLKSVLAGPTAIIVGGENPSGVAKIVHEYQKKSEEKIEVKAAVLNGGFLSVDEVIALSKLPSLEILQAQLLGLFNTPAQQTVTVLQASAQSLLNVLNAKIDQDN